ncbi:MAG TPA: NADPH:quinone oxidoreductase family protein [Ramlibacter sp.]|nr:NADPH:quinone oxidoreductase family protein [Ramlibacter sp.]
MLQWTEIEWPVPKAGQVVVEAHATGVNYPDLLVIRGGYQNLAPLPFSPGKEVAGTVAAVGPGVDTLRIGDRVLAYAEYGCYAERIALRAVDSCMLPEGIDFADAIGIGLTFQTAHFALFERARLQPGETVLVTGATGGVGDATVQLAKAHGAYVIAAIGTRSKAEFARAQGADELLYLDDPQLADRLPAQVRELTGGRGVDVVVENLGSPVFEACLRSLARSGRIVVVGFAGGPPASLRSNYLLIKNLTATGLHWSDYRDDRPELVRSAQAEIFGHWQAGRLRSPVTAAYRLHQAAIPLRHMADRRALGKFVLLTDRYQGRLAAFISHTSTNHELSHSAD